MLLYKGQVNKKWYSFSKLFAQHGQFLLTMLIGWYLLLTPVAHIPSRSFINASLDFLSICCLNIFRFGVSPRISGM